MKFLIILFMLLIMLLLTALHWIIIITAQLTGCCIYWDDAPASYLTWGGEVSGPYKVVNVPGIWQNERTEALDADYDNIKEENNTSMTMTLDDLGLGTDPLPQAAADVFIAMEQSPVGCSGCCSSYGFYCLLFW